MDGRAWWAAAYGVAKSRTRLSDFTFTFHFPALEKEMATRGQPFLLDYVTLATTLADITPISQISKLSFKIMYISQDHLLVLVNHRSGI